FRGPHIVAREIVWLNVSGASSLSSCHRLPSNRATVTRARAPDRHNGSRLDELRCVVTVWKRGASYRGVMTWPIGRPPPFAEWRNAALRLMPFTVAYKKEYSRYHLYSRARYASRRAATPTL